MPTCQECGQKFPSRVVIDGKRRNLTTRKRCLSCSPFGEHNRRRVGDFYDFGDQRKCSGCLEVKPITEFHRIGNNRLSRRCKTCWSEYHAKHYADNPDMYKAKAAKRNGVQREAIEKFVLEYLQEHPCVDCGESEVAVLEFDHVSGRKEFNLGDAKRSAYSIERVKLEIAKCAVRCANCHRRRHYYEKHAAVT